MGMIMVNAVDSQSTTHSFVLFKLPAFRFVLEREAEICSLHIRVEDDHSLLGCSGDVGRFVSTAKRPKGLAVGLNLKETKTKQSLKGELQI